MPFTKFGLPELLIILVIIILVFGVGRIGKIAGEMGKGIRSFKDGLAGKDAEKPSDAEAKMDAPRDDEPS
jgi:sec-independent protein translocase protein TatA